MTGAQSLPPQIAAGAEARDLEIDHVAEELNLLRVNVAIAQGYADLGNEVGLSYATRTIAAHCKAIVEADARLAEMRRERARVEGPELEKQGCAAAALGEEALKAFWRGLNNAQQAAIDGMQRVAWKSAAKRADGERAARAEPKEAAA